MTNMLLLITSVPALVMFLPLSNAVAKVDIIAIPG